MIREGGRQAGLRPHGRPSTVKSSGPSTSLETQETQGQTERFLVIFEKNFPSVPCFQIAHGR